MFSIISSLTLPSFKRPQNFLDKAWKQKEGGKKSGNTLQGRRACWLVVPSACKHWSLREETAKLRCAPRPGMPVGWLALRCCLRFGNLTLLNRLFVAAHVPPLWSPFGVFSPSSLSCLLYEESLNQFLLNGPIVVDGILVTVGSFLLMARKETACYSRMAPFWVHYKQSFVKRVGTSYVSFTRVPLLYNIVADEPYLQAQNYSVSHVTVTRSKRKHLGFICIVLESWQSWKTELELGWSMFHSCILLQKNKKGGNKPSRGLVRWSEKAVC